MKMMRFLFMVMAITLTGGCSGSSEKMGAGEESSLLSEDEGMVTGIPELTFLVKEKSLGDIVEGEQIVTYFRYENTGNEPLLIQSIKAGCGCTVPVWNKEPLLPGELEKIKVIFNSSGKKGSQNIRITVNSNARNSVANLVIKGMVTEKQ